jgi:hypothetical protein
LFFLAKSNKPLIRRSDSPIHLLTIFAAETEKKFPWVSVAAAFAKKLLPVPGGPYKRIPFQGLRFPWNNWGNLMGNMTASFKASLAFSKPATSSHFTLGFSWTIQPLNCSSNFFFSSSASLSPPFLSFLVNFFSFISFARKT